MIAIAPTPPVISPVRAAPAMHRIELPRQTISRGTSDRFPFPYPRADGVAFLSGQVVDLSGPVFAIEIAGEACGGIGLPSRAPASKRSVL